MGVAIVKPASGIRMVQGDGDSVAARRMPAGEMRVSPEPAADVAGLAAVCIPLGFLLERGAAVPGL